MSILFILQYLITAALDRVYMEVVAQLPGFHTIADATVPILGPDAIVSSLLLCILK